MNYNEQKRNTVALINQLLSLEKVRENVDTAKLLTDTKNRILSEKIVAVVAGEFKRGKSSLINAFLNEADFDLFPVDEDITTNLVTSISYGDQEKIDVVVGDPGKEESVVITRDQIADYVTEQKNQGNQKKARLMSIQSPNDVLKDGITIVDTPGVAINPEHTAITYAFIPNADLVIYATDVQAPLSETEIDFITRIYAHCKNIIFVVTKKDLVRDYDEVVKSDREKLSQALKISPDAVHILAVSSTAKKEYMSSHDKEDLEDSGFEKLESDIFEIVRNRRAALTLMPALGVISKTLIDLKTPLIAEWNACQKEFKEKSVQKQQEYQKALEDQKLFLDKNAEWRSSLSDGMRKIRYEMNVDLANGFTQVNVNLDNYLENTKLIKDPNAILTRVEQDLDSLMINITNNVRSKAGELHGRLEEMTGLTLKLDELENLGFSIDEADKVDHAKRVGIVEKSLVATRMATFNGTAGATIGGLIGSFFGGVGALPGYVIGGALGSLIGIISGARQGMESIQDKDRMKVRMKINPLISKSSQQCKLAAEKMISDLEISIRDNLNEQIKKQNSKLTDMIESVRKALAMSDQQAAARAKELDGQIKQANELLRVFNSVAYDIDKSIQSAAMPAKDKNAQKENSSPVSWAD